MLVNGVPGDWWSAMILPKRQLSGIFSPEVKYRVLLRMNLFEWQHGCGMGMWLLVRLHTHYHVFSVNMTYQATARAM
jgi:hypothetical protein